MWYGQLSEELALRGCQVVAADISPSLLNVARSRIPDHLHQNIEFVAGDMVSSELGKFDYVIAMDSLIYYRRNDLRALLLELSSRVSIYLFYISTKNHALNAYVVHWQTSSKRRPLASYGPHSLKSLKENLSGNWN